jgi:phosphodiesterase/alkaline phosphatase D-like protein
MATERIFAGPWVGAVTATGATVKAAVMRNVGTGRLIVGEDEGLTVNARVFPVAQEPWEDEDQKYEYRIASFQAAGLTPSTTYHYAIELDGSLAQSDVRDTPMGRFRTFPGRDDRASFAFGLGSCSSNKVLPFDPFLAPEAFVALGKEADQLLFFCHLGDFYYDIDNRKSRGKRMRKYDWVLRRPELQEFFRKLPVAYVWDDHDFLGNNAEGGDEANRRAREVALDAYDVYVPHYEFASRTNGIYQEFAVGRVLVLLTDTRFNRSPRSGSGTSGKTMLGANQKRWLKSRLEDAANWDLVVWANSVPWVGPEDPKKDFWAGYGAERREIATFVKQKGIRNLCMVSGDAHMLAIDDGSNSGYADPAGGGFPVFHVASMESKPSEKGGPYSHGRTEGGAGPGIPGRRQYGVFRIDYTDPSDPIVHWEGRRAKKHLTEETPGEPSEVVLRHRFRARETFAGF